MRCIIELKHTIEIFFVTGIYSARDTILVGSEVLAAWTKTSSVFWDIMPCSMDKVYRYSACCLLLAGFLPVILFDSENGGEIFVNVSLLLLATPEDRTLDKRHIQLVIIKVTNGYCSQLAIYH
jgi:hypothetical protein